MGTYISFSVLFSVELVHTFFKRLFIVFSFTPRPQSCLRSQQSIRLLSFQRDVRWNISQSPIYIHICHNTFNEWTGP